MDLREITIHDQRIAYPERTERLVLVGSGGLGREVNPLLRFLSLPGSEAVLHLVCAARVRTAIEAVGGSAARLALRPSWRNSGAATLRCSRIRGASGGDQRRIGTGRGRGVFFRAAPFILLAPGTLPADGESTAMSNEDTPRGIELSPGDLSPEARRGLIEEFVKSSPRPGPGRVLPGSLPRRRAQSTCSGA